MTHSYAGELKLTSKPEVCNFTGVVVLFGLDEIVVKSPELIPFEEVG